MDFFGELIEFRMFDVFMFIESFFKSSLKVDGDREWSYSITMN